MTLKASPGTVLRGALLVLVILAVGWVSFSLFGNENAEVRLSSNLSNELDLDLVRLEDPEVELEGETVERLLDVGIVEWREQVYVLLESNDCPQVDLSVELQGRRLLISTEVDDGRCDDLSIKWVARLTVDPELYDELVLR